MGSLLRGLVAAIIAAVLGLLLAPQATAAPAPASAPSCNYDGYRHSSPLTCAATKRGPPAAHDCPTTYDAVDRWSRGTSARLDATAPGTTTTYTAHAKLAQIAGAMATTLEHVRHTDGGLASLARLGVAAKSVPESTAVVGKVKDLGKVGDGEYTLLNRLPDLGSPKANWKQNSGVLRQVMGRGQPIRDASVGVDGSLVQYPGSFLNAERYLLQSRGWSFDSKTSFWMPPG